MIASHTRLFAASLTVLALALAGQAAAQQIPTPTTPAQDGPGAMPPAVVLPHDATPADAAPVQDEPEDGAPAEDAPVADDVPPHIVIADEPAEPAIPEVWSPIPLNDQERSAYGLYLAGKVALMTGEPARGADWLAQANSLTPEQPRVREQAFTSALLSGDLDVAARLAPVTDASPAFTEAGRLISAIQTFVHGDPRAANAALVDRPIASPHARAGLMVAPWIAAAAGDWTRALSAPPTQGDPLTLAFARQNRALLLEKRRNYAEAESELKALSDTPTIGALFHRPFGEFLERRGKKAEAQAVYQVAVQGQAVDLATARALERLQAGGRAPAAPDFREGAAQALTTAAAQAVAERGNEFAVVYLRLAQNLHEDAATQIQLAQVLDRVGLKSAARTALSRVGPEDPVLYSNARAQLAISLEEDGQSEAALTELRAAAAAEPADPRIALVMAGQLIQLKQYDQALELLNGPLLNTPNQGAQIHFLRGAALESLNRIPEAEAELWAAHQADPNNANTLNYLGYLWVDKGLRIDEGAGLLAQAHAAEPDNGNIQDSLGWAQFKQGHYENAVATLEEAVDKEPANAEINDHLGDAYWKVGRQREAVWLWNRVLILDAEPERKAEVERKIAEGLDGAGTAQGVSQ
ncbi:tetratricopeptide repeat protein [Brevundimonas sp.]|jgi:tetratricopeptide (TPR) repeat protein|uniref:tetratricopeptide repeat protein n=1 Tax=Brevundimonas sp. TaxID=1871086 RepID=UPI0037BE7573